MKDPNNEHLFSNDLDTNPSTEENAVFVVTHHHALKRMVRTGLLSLPPDRGSEPAIFESVLLPKSREEAKNELAQISLRKNHIPVIVELEECPKHQVLSAIPIALVKKVIVQNDDLIKRELHEIKNAIDAQVISISDEPDFFTALDQGAIEQDQQDAPLLKQQSWPQEHIRGVENGCSISLVFETLKAFGEKHRGEHLSEQFITLYEDLLDACSTESASTDPLVQLVGFIAGTQSGELEPFTQLLVDWRKDIKGNDAGSPERRFSLLDSLASQQADLDQLTKDAIQIAVEIADKSAPIQPSRLSDKDPASCMRRALCVVASGNASDLGTSFNFLLVDKEKRPGTEVLLRSMILLACFGNHRTKVSTFSPNAETDKSALDARSLLNAATVARTLQKDEEAIELISRIGGSWRRTECDRGLVELNYGGEDVNLVTWQSLSQEEIQERELVHSSQDLLRANIVDVLNRSNNRHLFKSVQMNNSFPHTIALELATPIDSVIEIHTNSGTGVYEFNCEVLCTIRKSDLGGKELDFRDAMPKCVHSSIKRDDTSGKTKYVGILLSVVVPTGSVDSNEAIHWLDSLQKSASLAREYFPTSKAVKKARKIVKKSQPKDS